MSSELKADSPNEPKVDLPSKDEIPPPPQNRQLRVYGWKKMWKENNNTLWTVVGDTGDGKSYAALSIGQLIDPNFGIENVAFSIADFLKKVNDDRFGRGSVIVLEEASVEASSYDWHSKSNRIFSMILDTWRNQNRMGVITLPNFKALEKGARRRTEAVVNMRGVKPRKRYSMGWFYNSDFGNIEDNFTTPIPEIDHKKRRDICFALPTEGLMDQYESEKSEYTDDLNERLLNELLEEHEENADGDGGKPTDPKKIADEILSSGVDEYVKVYNGMASINQELIEMDYEIGARKGKKVKAQVEREIDLDDWE